MARSEVGRLLVRQLEPGHTQCQLSPTSVVSRYFRTSISPGPASREVQCRVELADTRIPWDKVTHYLVPVLFC